MELFRDPRATTRKRTIIAGERMNSPRRGVVAVSLGVLVLLVAAGWRAAQIVEIGVAYKAKLVCSGIFVSKRDANAVLADLEVDDLLILKYIGVSTDRSTRTVTTSALGLLRRRAAFRDGIGCALVLDGLTPPPSPTPGAADTTGTRTARLDVLTIPGTAPRVARDELAAVVQGAFSEPNPQRPRRTQAVVVVHHGRVVGEQYATGIDADTPLIGWSMAKSVLNALVGVLVEQRRLTLDAPVAIPEWGEPDDPRGSISLDHLLRMSSGLRFDENMENPRADVMRMLLDVGDAAAFATKQVSVAAPGTRWQYSSGTSNIIARVIRNTLRNDSEYLLFPRQALFDRVGMAGAVLETDAAGTFVGSSYMYATARDWPDSACCTCKTGYGAMNGFFRRGGWRTPGRRRRRTRRRAMAPISGWTFRRSTAGRALRCRWMRFTQRATKHSS
jgi:hypothetical protein